MNTQELLEISIKDGLSDHELLVTQNFETESQIQNMNSLNLRVQNSEVQIEESKSKLDLITIEVSNMKRINDQLNEEMI